MTTPSFNTEDSILAPLDEKAKEYSVGEISSKIRQKLEQEFGSVQIKGEISGLKIATR